MTVELVRVPDADAEEPRERVVALQVIGKLKTSDFEVFEPRLELLLAQHGKLRLFIELVEFSGWTAGAAWEDIKLSLKHFNDLERVAVVGDRQWERGLTVLAKPLTAAKLRYFKAECRDAATAWLHEETGSRAHREA